MASAPSDGRQESIGCPFVDVHVDVDVIVIVDGDGGFRPGT